MPITSKSGRKLHLPTTAEDARIDAALDDVSPELDNKFFTTAKPAADVLGANVVAKLVAKRKRGRPVGSMADQTKEQVSIRLSPDVLEFFRASGPGWQSRVDSVLKEWVAKRA